jgi:hypothetical protein
MTCAAIRVNAMWKRVRVLRRIMPKPSHDVSFFCFLP